MVASPIATPFVPLSLSVAGSGSHWTLVWADPNPANSDAFCTTDAMDGGVQLMDFTAAGGTGPFGLVSAGMSSDGGVAVEVAKRYDQSVYLGTSRSVCPTQYDSISDNFDNGADGIGVVSMNVPTGDDGWRFGANSGGYLEVAQLDLDGGGVPDDFTNDSLNLQLPLELSAVASNGSSRVHAVVLAQPDAGQYELDTYAIDATSYVDQTPPRITLYPGTVDDFTSASCPASTPAIATAFIPAVTTGDVSVAFMRDDPSEAPLGQGTYDVTCHQNFASSTSSVSVACAGGRVGVLFSNNLSAASQVQLYLCELPPLN
jgi:hypothetical protein